jgi:hypothetical protein
VNVGSFARCIGVGASVSDSRGNDVEDSDTSRRADSGCYLRSAVGARRATPRRIHGVRLAIAATARSERRIAVRGPGVGVDTSAASADPARAPWRSTARSCQVPGTPRDSTLWLRCPPCSAMNTFWGRGSAFVLSSISHVHPARILLLIR